MVPRRVRGVGACAVRLVAARDEAGPSIRSSSASSCCVVLLAGPLTWDHYLDVGAAARRLAVRLHPVAAPRAPATGSCSVPDSPSPRGCCYHGVSVPTPGPIAADWSTRLSTTRYTIATLVLLGVAWRMLARAPVDEPATTECPDEAEQPLWEQHAQWWQQEFTDGADPEYEEQILPLVERHLAGATARARRRVRRRPGGAPGRRARRRPSSAWIRPATRSTSARERARGPVVRRGDGRAAAVPRRRLRRGGHVPGHRAPRPVRARDPRDGPGARARRALPPAPEPPAAPDAGERLDRRPHPRGAVLAGRALPPRTTRPSRKWPPG